MINATGMIETDKLILEIANKTALKNNFLLWKKILIKHNAFADSFTAIELEASDKA